MVSGGCASGGEGTWGVVLRKGASCVVVDVKSASLASVVAATRDGGPLQCTPR